ncbi:MAG: hypothetical protein P8Y63_03545 [Deltaproteobacteria bacterium]|jgi:hypothetical protein
MDKTKLAIKIKVDSRIDERGEKIPRRLHIEGEPADIVEVVDRWLANGRVCFKVLDDEGGMYIVRYDPEARVWELVMMEQG